MTELPQEITLAKVRLHWGIFIPVLFLAFCPLLAFLPVLFMFHGLINALNRLGMPANPSLNLIWLFAMAPYFVIVMGLFLGTWFTYSKSEVVLTDHRLIFRTGVLSRRSGELPLENVESIYISEPVLGRLCGYGTVRVTSVSGAQWPLWFVGSPKVFLSTLQKAVRTAKNQIKGVDKTPDRRLPPQDVDSRYKPKA